jgi:hypothetical protein
MARTPTLSMALVLAVFLAAGGLLVLRLSDDEEVAKTPPRIPPSGPVAVDPPRPDGQGDDVAVATREEEPPPEVRGEIPVLATTGARGDEAPLAETRDGNPLAIEELDPEKLADEIPDDPLLAAHTSRPGPGPLITGTCHGVLVEEDGSPVTGEAVWLWGDPHGMTITDPSGRFWLDSEWVDPRGRGLMLGPSSGAVRISLVKLVPQIDLDLGSIEVPGALPVSVRVVRQDTGQGVAGAHVLVDPPTGPLDVVSPHLRGITDAAGRVEFARARRTYHGLIVLARGYRTERGGQVNLRQGPPDAPSLVEMIRARPLLVHIPGWPKGVTAQARVWFEAVDSGLQFYRPDVEIREDGIGIVESPVAGSYRGFVECEAWREALPEFVVTDDEITVVELDRPAGPTLRGRVLVGKEEPLDHGEVRSRSGRGASPIGKDGSFLLHPLRPGGLILGIEFPEEQLFEVTRLSVDDEDEMQVEVELPAGSFSGRIVGPPLPLEGSCRLQRRDGNRWTNQGYVRLRADGTFEAHYREEGVWKIQIGSLAGGEASELEFELVPGARKDGLSIPWKANPEVVFVVTREDENPPPTSIFVSPRGARGFRVDVDSAGYGRSRDLAVGKWTLQVRASSAYWADVEVEVPEKGPCRVEVKLQEPKER